MACVNAHAGEEERQAEPGWVDRQQHRAAHDGARRGQRQDRREHDADAGRGTNSRRAPSSTLDPRRRSAREEARREEPLRPRQKADEREPEHDEHEAGQLDLPVEGQHAADAAAPAPRITKTTVNPAMNGGLPSATLRAAPGFPSRSASMADTADR